MKKTISEYLYARFRGEERERDAPTVLILSSHVAASPVGGGAQVQALAALGLTPMLVPTVLFGRHPGLGAPGGGPVDVEMFEDMLAAVAASGALERLDALITGYFADARQVWAAARTIDAARAASPAVRIVVDPIMGDDEKGLYVTEDVAQAVAEVLVPLADLVTPNAWELRRLTAERGLETLAAARALGRPVLASSIDVGDEIGVIYADAHEAWLAAHARVVDAEHGAGDLLTAWFTAALARGLGPRDGLEDAVEAVVARVGAPGAVRLEALG